MEFMKRWMNTRVSQPFDVVVIGGGAAGMLAAGTAAARGMQVCLVEKQARPGRKLMITGKGRCNLTNDCDVQEFIASVPSNGRFFIQRGFGVSTAGRDAFLRTRGYRSKWRGETGCFLRSDRAVDVVDTLVRYMKRGGVEMLMGQAAKLLLEQGHVQGIELQDGACVLARNVLIACGGASYPGTGSTGDGYVLARQAGHTVVPLRPSLVPLVAKGTDCSEMMGLSLKNTAIRVLDTQKKKEIYSDFGEMLFTHFGVSGPMILSASAHMRDMAPGRYRIAIDLKPALRPEQLDARLQRDFWQ